MDEFSHDGMTFDVLDVGPAGGTPVVLLHGFPQFNTSWTPIMDRLTADGYRCVAPNQRGYSRRARPRRRRDYKTEQLVGDVVALIDALDVPKVHLVGHDWGAAAAWATAAVAPDRLATVTALSVPHPAAFFKAMATSRQFLASWYMYFFQLPWIPEWLITRDGGKQFARLLGEGLSPDGHQSRDVRQLMETGSLTTALNWYRAIPLNKPGMIRTKVTVPTLYVWSDRDVALLEKAASDTAGYVTGEYRFEVIRGATHWLPDEHPDKIADLLLDWFAAHPVPAA